MSDVSSPLPPFRLVVVAADTTETVFAIEEGVSLIGRWDPESTAYPEIDLEAVDEEAKVSRKHAVIERRGSVVTLEDVGSKNGTFVNQGEQLQQGIPVTLQPGDDVLIGKTLLRFEKGS